MIHGVNLAKYLQLSLLCLCLSNAAHALQIEQNAPGNIFVTGEQPSLTLRGATGPVKWSIRDFFNNQVAGGTAVIDGASAVVKPAISTDGFYLFHAVSTENEQADTSLAIVPASRQETASPFGVMTHFAKGWPIDIIPLIRKAGIRLIRDEQPWRQIEKTRGVYRFPERLTGYMAALASSQIDPLIVLAFGNPLYDEGQAPYSDEGRSAFTAYAKAVATQYGPQLHAVEIWNEYNGSFCDGPCRSDRAGYYTRMLQPTYEALKAADRDLAIAGGAAVPIPLDYFQRLFADGALKSSDAVVIHPYRRQPEGVGEKIDQLRTLIARFGDKKPVWATEFSDLADMHKSREDVARYLVRMAVLLRAANVERLYYYLFKDFQEFTGLGLIRNETDPFGRYVPAPAYCAYAALIHQLGSLAPDGQIRLQSTAQVFRFKSADRTVLVAWSLERPSTIILPQAPGLHLVTMMGGELPLPIRNGHVEIQIDTNPIYIQSKGDIAISG